MPSAMSTPRKRGGGAVSVAPARGDAADWRLGLVRRFGPVMQYASLGCGVPALIWGVGLLRTYGKAAVGHDHLSGDIARLLGGQKDNDLGDIVGFTDPSQRNPPGSLLHARRSQ